MATSTESAQIKGEQENMIVILGPTGSGKSTLAAAIADIVQKQEDVHVISAGKWARTQFGIEEKTPEAAQQLWNLTQEHLSYHPHAITNWLSQELETCRPVIVEGIRSVIDFIHIAKLRPNYMIVQIIDNHTEIPLFEQNFDMLINNVYQVIPPNFILRIPAKHYNATTVNFLATSLLEYWNN